MQLPRSIGTGVAVVVLLAACSGGPGATTGPGGATQNPGGATTNPGGNGGPLPGNGSGKVTYQLSGPVSASGELPFFGIGSRFDGVAGQVFQFVDPNDDGGPIFTVFPAVGTTDQWLVGYVSEEFNVSATACTISGWQTSATDASGSFDCPNAIVTKVDGSMFQDGKITGRFEAHK